MACETRLRENQTLQERFEETRRAVKSLETALQQGRVQVAIAPNGAVAFKGWAQADRRDMTDACAYRTLAASSSFALRQAVQRAEATSGRKVNPNAVGGVHSHDGGKTWETH